MRVQQPEPPKSKPIHVPRAPLVRKKRSLQGPSFAELMHKPVDPDADAGTPHPAVAARVPNAVQARINQRRGWAREMAQQGVPAGVPRGPMGVRSSAQGPPAHLEDQRWLRGGPRSHYPDSKWLTQGADPDATAYAGDRTQQYTSVAHGGDVDGSSPSRSTFVAHGGKTYRPPQPNLYAKNQQRVAEIERQIEERDRQVEMRARGTLARKAADRDRYVQGIQEQRIKRDRARSPVLGGHKYAARYNATRPDFLFGDHAAFQEPARYQGRGAVRA